MPPNSSNVVLTSSSTSNKAVIIPPKSILVENKIYSAKKISSFHPGGPFFINAFAGRDATEVFIAYHRRRFPHSRAKPALESTLVNDYYIEQNQEMSHDFLELCERVNKVLPRNQGFATWAYYAKATFLLATCIGLEMVMHWTGNYRWWISALVGWIHGLIAMNIQHDANHGAVSRRPWVNRLWGYSISWIGGSVASWTHLHSVQHHVHTNDMRKDPDIYGKPFLRLNPLKPLLKWQIFQHIYFFVIICLFGTAIIFSSFTSVLTHFEHTPMSPLMKTQCRVDTVWSLLYFFRWYALPLYQQPTVWTLLNCVPTQIVMGWYIEFFAAISHNFGDVVQLDSEEEKKKGPKSLVYKQAATSCNVGGSLLWFLNGGLNYQIEHHLFPRINHVHIPKIAPIVKEFCRERSIPYKHFPTLWENTVALYLHLADMGKNREPKAARNLDIRAK